jgi:beta-glucuronidase
MVSRSAWYSSHHGGTTSCRPGNVSAPYSVKMIGLSYAETQAEISASRVTSAVASCAGSLTATRPVGFVNVMLAPYGKCRVSQFSDVLMLNRYYGWYVNNGDLPAVEQAWEQELRRWVSEGKPIIITEYGADTYPGLHAVTPTPWTEEHQVEYLAMNHRVFDRFEAVVGEQVWNFAGFATTPGVMRVGGNKKGVFTRDRQPKEAAWALRRRWCGAG